MLILAAGNATLFYILGGILVVVGIVLAFVGRSRSTLKADMEATETSTIDALIGGSHVEVKGAASADTPLSAPGDSRPCVYYRYEVKREEIERDSKGAQRRTWRTIDRGESEAAFWLTDETGSVLVEPKGAKVDAPKVYDNVVDRSAGAAQMGGMLGGILSGLSAMAGAREKVIVHAIDVNQSLYVLGDVSRGGDELPRITKGDGKFFISTRDEEALVTSLGRAVMGFYIGAAVTGVGGIVLLFYGMTSG